MAKNRSREEEPSIAPKPDRWYNLKLGPSFRDHHPSSKFCTLRYEFKPASVDKTRAGSLHKTKDNKVTVEFQNNQHGKPKVIFEGVTEDYKDNDAVLFFDGESFCLEQLHRAVKRLRHVRDLGEAAASSGAPLSTSYVGAAAESYPLSVGKAENDQFLDKEPPKIELENVDVESDDPDSGLKTKQENLMDTTPVEGNTSTEIPDATNYESDGNVDIDDGHGRHELTKEEEETHYRAEVHRGLEIDINIPHQDDEEDLEIADVDESDGEVNNTGFNAAEALRAQVAGEQEKRSSSSSSLSSSSSSSSSSGSSSSSASSSDTGSASSGSSDSGSSHDESVTSV